MKIEKFEKAESIISEARRLMHERDNVGHMFKDSKPSKGTEKWLNEIRSKLEEEIKILEKEFESI